VSYIYSFDLVLVSESVRVICIGCMVVSYLVVYSSVVVTLLGTSTTLLYTRPG